MNPFYLKRLSYTYDDATRALSVRFEGGALHVYKNVHPETVRRLKHSKNKPAYVFAAIRTRYQCEEIR